MNFEMHSQYGDGFVSPSVYWSPYNRITIEYV